MSTLSNGVVELTIDQNLETDNYFFFNEGRIGSDPKTVKKLSLGIFNHVFTISKEDLKREIESSLDE